MLVRRLVDGRTSRRGFRAAFSSLSALLSWTPAAALKELQETRHLDLKSSTKQYPPIRTSSTPKPEVSNAPTPASPSKKKTRARSLYHDFMSDFWKREKFSIGSVVEKRRRMSMEWQRTRESLFNNEDRSGPPLNSSLSTTARPPTKLPLSEWQIFNLLLPSPFSPVLEAQRRKEFEMAFEEDENGQRRIDELILQFRRKHPDLLSPTDHVRPPPVKKPRTRMTGRAYGLHKREWYGQPCNRMGDPENRRWRYKAAKGALTEKDVQRYERLVAQQPPPPTRTQHKPLFSHWLAFQCDWSKRNPHVPKAEKRRLLSLAYRQASREEIEAIAEAASDSPITVSPPADETDPS